MSMDYKKAILEYSIIKNMSVNKNESISINLI